MAKLDIRDARVENRRLFQPRKTPPAKRHSGLKPHSLVPPSVSGPLLHHSLAVPAACKLIRGVAAATASSITIAFGQQGGDLAALAEDVQQMFPRRGIEGSRLVLATEPRQGARPLTTHAEGYECRSSRPLIGPPGAIS